MHTAFRHPSCVLRDFTLHFDHMLMLPLCAKIDTDTYLVWLRRLVEDKGATVKKVPALKGKLIDQETALRKTYKAHAILNATGLGAMTLAPDELSQPVR